MNQKENDVFHYNSDTQADKNISRLVKLASDPGKPGRAFTELLIDSALNELGRSEAGGEQKQRDITVKISWWEKAMGLAAMIALVCLAGLSILISKINIFFAVIVLAVTIINRFVYLGGLIL